MSAGRFNPESENRLPFLFVVGCPRSGTTLLQRMLDHHPRLAVANDTHFIPRVIEGTPPGVDPPLTPELVERVRSYHRFDRLGLNGRAVAAAAAAAATYSEFVGRLYGHFARHHHKPLAGEKTPDYVRRLLQLHGLFPWVRTAHIIRDGRNVALSTQDWARPTKGPGRLALWREQPVAVCALWWKWQVEAGRRDGAVLGPDHYREVRYEELVSNSEKLLRDLCRFFGLSFAGHMLRYHEGKTRSGSHLSAKKAWLPPTPGLRDWRTQMPEGDVALFEAIAGDLLEELGYPLSGRTLSPSVEAEARRCQRWWDEHRQRRRSKHLVRERQAV